MPHSTGLDALKTATNKVALKVAETTGEFLGSKATDKIVKPKPVSEANSGNVEEIIIPPRKR